MGFDISDLNMAMISKLSCLDADSKEFEDKYAKEELTVSSLIDANNGTFGDFSAEQILNFKQVCGEWKITNVMNKNSESTCYLYGFVVEPENGKGIVTFRGSKKFNENLNDWKNNFAHFNRIDEKHQESINEYIKDGIFDKYTELGVTGYVLGGNDANYFTTGTSKLKRNGNLINIQDKITDCRTFNAIGHSAKYIEDNKDTINDKYSIIKNFQDEHDLVSSILHSLTPAIIIKSNGDYNEDILNNSTLNFNEDGTCATSESGKKDFVCDIVNELTLQLEKSPEFEVGSLISTLNYIENNTEFKDYLMLYEYAIDAGVSKAEIISFFQSAAFMKGIKALYSNSKNFAAEIDAWCFLAKKYNRLINIAEKHGGKVKREVCDSLGKKKQFINYKINKLRNIESIRSGNYATNETIKVKTEDLVMVIKKINLIQSILNLVNERIEILKNSESLSDSEKTTLLYLNIGQDIEITKSLKYLDNVLDSIAICERKIKQKAERFK